MIYTELTKKSDEARIDEKALQRVEKYKKARQILLRAEKTQYREIRE